VIANRLTREVICVRQNCLGTGSRYLKQNIPNTPKGSEMEKRLEQVIALVKEVGAIQIANCENKHQIVKKSTQFDLVTEVDKLSEKMIIDFIGARYPEDSILAEESGQMDGRSEYIWVVDPLDGTTNYTHRFPVYSISIGLQRGDEAVLGVVYAPVLDELFHAVRGRGAFLNGQSIVVSSCANLEDSLLGTGFPYDRSGLDNNLLQFNHFCPLVQGIRRTGSAAYDLCCVAAGRFDGFWEYQLHPWDVAAATLIVEEAGGSVLYLSREGLDVSLAAGNRLICDQIWMELQKTAGVLPASDLVKL